MLQILLRENYRFDEKRMLHFLKTLQTYRRRKERKLSLKKVLVQLLHSGENFKFIIDCDGNEKVSFYLADHTGNEERFKDSLMRLFGKDADVFTISEDKKRELESYTVTQTLSFECKKSDYHRDEFQLKRFDEDILGYIIDSVPKHTRLIIDFSIRSLSLKELKKKRGFEESDHSELECMIHVQAKTKYMRNHLFSFAQTIQNLTRHTGYFDISMGYKYKPFKISTEYMLNLLSFPSIQGKQNKIPVLKKNQRTLKDNEFSTGIKIGTLDHPNQKNRDVRIAFELMKTHMRITGMTGSGKSSVFEEIAKDILIQKLEGKTKIGFSFFDPAATSALGVINILNQLEHEGYDTTELLNKVHYIEFDSSSDNSSVFTMNLLDKNVNKEKHMDFFRDIFGDGNTPQLNRLLINSIAALIEDEKDHVITDVIKLLMDEEYRLDILDRLKSNRYASTYVEFLENGIPKASSSIDPVLNRLDIFYNSINKKRVFCSGKSDLNRIKQWMDSGHILLFNLAGMSDKDIQVIVGYILLQYYNVGVKRSVGSNSHYVIVDEDHKVQLKIVKNIRAELRKFGVHFIGMTQFLEQYTDDYLLDITSNVGVKVVLKHSDKSATRVSRDTNLDKEDLQNLASRHGYVYTEMNGEYVSIPFVANPPYRYHQGKLIKYEDSENFQNKIAQVLDENRKFGQRLSKRDFTSVEDIDEIIFRTKVDKSVSQDDSIFD